MTPAQGRLRDAQSRLFLYRRLLSMWKPGTVWHTNYTLYTATAKEDVLRALDELAGEQERERMLATPAERVLGKNTMQSLRDFIGLADLLPDLGWVLREVHPTELAGLPFKPRKVKRSHRRRK